MPESQVDIAVYRRYIEAALKYAGGTHNFEDVTASVAEGRRQFWPGIRSAIITEVLEYPRNRTLNFFLAGGDAAELEAMEPLILDWGRTQGCTTAAMIGRRGWERTWLTQRAGWKPTLAVFEKAL